MAALDALGNFNFAFAREQRNRAHLAQIHADRVISFFQRAGREIEFHILAGFNVCVELLVTWDLGPFEHIDALRADGGQQVFDVVGRLNIVGNQVIHLVVSEITFLFSHIDQFFDIVVLIF